MENMKSPSNLSHEWIVPNMQCFELDAVACWHRALLVWHSGVHLYGPLQLVLSLEILSA